MEGRKVLILLDHKAGALSCIRFVVQVFRHKRTVVVIGFTTHRALQEDYRAIKKEVYDEFGSMPNLKLIYRNQSVLNGDSIIQESQYCDVIVQPNQSIFGSRTPQNNGLSANTNLPVVTIPRDFEVISDVLIAHSGEFEQFKFIKLFFQILGDLCREVNVTLVELNHNASHFTQDDEKLFVEYLRAHCPNFGIIKAAGESTEKLLEMVNFTRGIVVTGNAKQFQFPAINHPAVFWEFNPSNLAAQTSLAPRSV